MKTEDTVTVVKAENFKALPLATQKLIIDLSKDLKISGLNILNPLVENMAIIEGFKAIKYNAEDEGTVEQYAEAKAFIRSFRARTKEAKSDLKKPLLDTGKKLDLIEKTFVNAATGVHDELDLEFKPYLDEIQRKKDEALAKKNAATTAKIKELTEETTAQQIALQRSILFNKYNTMNQNILNDIISKVENYSKDSLQIELMTLNNTEFEWLETDRMILLPEQHQELIDGFDKIRKTCINMITSKMTELTLLKEREDAEIADKIKREQATKEIEKASNFIAPSISTSQSQSFRDAFEEQMNSTIKYIAELTVRSDRENKAQQSSIAGLRSYSAKIISYLDEEN